MASRLRGFAMATAIQAKPVAAMAAMTWYEGGFRHDKHVDGRTCWNVSTYWYFSPKSSLKLTHWRNLWVKTMGLWLWNIIAIWLVVWNMAGLFSIIYGMSSFPLTNSFIFFKMVIAPPTSDAICWCHFISFTSFRGYWCSLIQWKWNWHLNTLWTSSLELSL